jgi:hypothetical protein
MSLLSCESVRPHLGAFVDDELTGRERLQVVSHLERCPTCGAEAEDLRGLGAVLRSTASAEPFPAFAGLASGVIGRVRAERAQSWRAVFERAVGDWHWVVVGAGSVFATTITTSVVWLVLLFGPAPVREDSLAALLTNLSTSPGSMFLIVSPKADAKRLTLMQISDAASSRHVPATTRMSERELVDALAFRLEQTGWRGQLHSMTADQRRHVESLLDDISRPRLAEPALFGPQITVRQVHLVTETSVTAKGL